MAHSHADFRMISNSKITSRFRQFLVLITVICIGMIISIVMNS